MRWSKKAKITLETISFWRNISISISKFCLFSANTDIICLQVIAKKQVIPNNKGARTPYPPHSPKSSSKRCIPRFIVSKDFGKPIRLTPVYSPLSKWSLDPFFQTFIICRRDHWELRFFLKPHRKEENFCVMIWWFISKVFSKKVLTCRIRYLQVYSFSYLDFRLFHKYETI